MSKKLFFVSISLVGILVLPIFSLGQTTGQAQAGQAQADQIQAGQAQAPSLSQIDCSQYTNTQEKLMCNYFNTLLQLYILLIQQLQAKIGNPPIQQPVEPVKPIQPIQPVQPVQPSIKVLSPNGGEVFDKEKGAFTASWKNTTGKGVDIYLLGGDSTKMVLQTIAKNFSGNSYPVQVDPYLLQKDVNRFYLRVCETNTNNCDDSDNTFSVNALTTQQLTINNSSLLPSGNVGKNYTVILNVSGGPVGVSTNSYNWSISSGSLPNGLYLGASDYGEMIIGTPTVAGTYNFTINVSYGLQSGSKQFTLVINPAETQPSIQPSITVVSPNGGEVFDKEKGAFTASWKNTTGKGVDIYLLGGDSTKMVLQTIAKNFSGNSYPVQVDPYLLQKDVNRFYLRVCETNTNNCDDSDNTFSVNALTSYIQPSITIFSPLNNQILTSPINISWTETPMSAGANFSIEIKALESNYYTQGVLVFSTTLTSAQANCTNNNNCFYSVGLLPGKYSLMITDNNVKGGVSSSVVFEVREAYAAISYFTAWPIFLNSGDTTNFQFEGKNISYYDLKFNCSVAVRGIYSNSPGGLDVCNTIQRIPSTSFNFPVQFINDGNYVSSVIATLSAYDVNNKVVDTKSVTVTINPKSTVSSPSNPFLSINKNSFLTTDTWQLNLTGAQPNQQVYICAIDNKGNQSCTLTQNLGLRQTTDSNGNWSASGNWNGDESVVGTWREWIYVGGTLQGNQVIGGTKSNEIQFTISRPQSSMLNSLNQMANILNSLNSVLNYFR